MKRVRKEGAKVSVGKRGLTEGSLNEISKRLKREGILKVRMRVAVEDRERFAVDASRRLGAKLLEVRGNTFIVVRDEASTGRGKGSS
ncbi:YhbY family RNA-binding protein [Sulfodiicoccus acidiphilus]|uniref:YhbY family RNA-binding protein n=1 Tax=Sulfodiicoccus acidiphilus TaxID=1670455 RepID=UPI00227D788E|nr:YhbY family RNA-binding protein [Sulfodiicoccus acidiphilus]